jgi:hypothetical protein
VDGCGWVWMGVDGCGWVWMGVDGVDGAAVCISVVGGRESRI